MLKKWLSLLTALLLPFSCALAQGADDGLQGYTEDELLDMMAQLPEDGEDDNSAFLVLPEDISVAERCSNGSSCAQRRFRVRTLAHYVDFDSECDCDRDD